MAQTASSAKTSEFARLFDLFERLASHRPSRRGAGAPTDAIRNIDVDMPSVPVPEEFAPVLQKLARLVNTRANRPRDEQAKARSGGRRRRNTVAVPSNSLVDDGNSESDSDSVARFPLEKQYPFTFKLMLHKLYELEEWAKKVKDVLERSQIEFKPLAELESKAIENVEEDGHIHFQPGVASRRGGVPPGRPRSHSMTTGKRKENNGVPVTLGVQSQVVKHQKNDVNRDHTRALKKRCVGRRKSMSGPMSSDLGNISGGWVYDATVSAAEFQGTIPSRRQPLATLESVNVNESTRSDATRSEVRRSRYRSLGLLDGPGMTTRIAPKRITSAATVPQTERNEESFIAKKKIALKGTDAYPNEGRRFNLKCPPSA